MVIYVSSHGSSHFIHFHMHRVPRIPASWILPVAAAAAASAASTGVKVMTLPVGVVQGMITPPANGKSTSPVVSPKAGTKAPPVKATAAPRADAKAPPTKATAAPTADAKAPPTKPAAAPKTPAPKPKAKPLMKKPAGKPLMKKPAGKRTAKDEEDEYEESEEDENEEDEEEEEEDEDGDEEEEESEEDEEEEEDSHLDKEDKQDGDSLMGESSGSGKKKGGGRGARKEEKGTSRGRSVARGRGGGRGRASIKEPAFRTFKQLSKKVRRAANKANGLTAEGMPKAGKKTKKAMKAKAYLALANKKRKEVPLSEKLEGWNKILHKAATGRMGRLIGCFQFFVILVFVVCFAAGEIPLPLRNRNPELNHLYLYYKIPFVRITYIWQGYPNTLRHNNLVCISHEASKADAADQDARDKNKGRKWARLKAANQLPVWVLGLYEQCGQATGRKRDEQTNLINTLFKKNPKSGEYELVLDDPCFREAQKQYHDAKFGNEWDGLILEEAQAKVGGENQLKRALAGGRVRKVVKDKLEWYVFRNIA